MKVLHKNWIRVMIVVLSICMLIPMLAACNEDNPDKEEGGVTVPPTNSTIPDIYDVEDSLPESFNYGTTFNILYYSSKMVGDFWVDARTGGVIDNAVFDAISRTEERFGVDIVATTSGAGDEIGHINSIRTQITGGNPDFDIARGHDVQGANLSLEGVLYDLNDIEVLDFSKPWWPKETIESLSFMGQIYLVSSSISYRGLDSTSAVFFNKALMEDHGVALPYDQVKSGDWYLEDMFISIEDFHLEGDMGFDGKSEDDTFGVVVPWQLYAWQESFGIELVQKDADTGELVLNGNDERIYDLFDVMYSVLWENDGGYLVERTKAQAIFGEGRAIYIPVHLGSAVTTFLNYSVDYGIVPYPKLDEEQDQYYAGYTDRYFLIPMNVPDVEYVGTILESMSAEGYRQVTPAYFEVALKNRYTKDQTSKEMVDLIKQSMVLDFAYVYGADKWWSRSLYALLRDTDKQEHSKDYASYYKTMLPEAESRVEFVTTKFEEMLAKKGAQ
jgi:ABC-type glycerol-3-phosphate transport system substrate-binding protein